MAQTATLNLRVNPEVKSEAENVLSQLGISMSTAVNMYLRQIALTGGIPFTLKLPAAPRHLDADAMSDDELRAVVSDRLASSESGNAVSLEDAVARLRG